MLLRIARIWRQSFGDQSRQAPLLPGYFSILPLLCFCLRGLFADGLVEFAGALIQLILHRLEQLHFRQIGNCLALLIATATGRTSMGTPPVAKR